MKKAVLIIIIAITFIAQTTAQKVQIAVLKYNGGGDSGECPQDSELD